MPNFYALIVSKKNNPVAFRSTAATPFHGSATPNDDDRDVDNDSLVAASQGWDERTHPFVVIRYFARDDATDIQIASILSEHSIWTLDKLWQNILPVIDVIREKSFSSFFHAVKTAREMNMKTLDEALGGQLIYDESCIEPNSLEYSPCALSVNYLWVPGRGNAFTLVVGPSGSGKTYFALNWLRDNVYGFYDNEYGTEDEPSEKDYALTVHFKAITAYDLMREKGLDKFSDAVASLVELKINEKLSTISWKDYNRKWLDLHLHVIIDDAGGDKFKEFFRDSRDLRNIIYAVEHQMTFKFKKSVRLTLVGTCLEIDLPYHRGSIIVECTKYYMQPLTEENIRGLTRSAIQYTNEETVLKIINRHPLLKSLTSNMRCASYLLNLMKNPSFRQLADREDFLNLAISKVAGSFIAASDLKNVNAPADRVAMARSVFTVIDKASKDPGRLFFPKFDELETETLRSAATCALDVNLHLEDRSPVLVMYKNASISISPALALILFILVNEKASTSSWDWKPFENSGALSDWQRTIAQSHGIHPAPDAEAEP
jgi:hypothetical protein